MADHREFNYRRLHSLLGVVPIGAFVVLHFVVNYFAVYGEESFNKASEFMESLPFLLVLETFLIYLPILFHAVLGVYIAFTTRNNVRKYGYFRNWMFKLQHITGIILFVFIVWHVWETRIQLALGNAELNYNLMEDILTNPFLFWFYILGVISVAFHFANGLWSFAVSWGISQSPKSQNIVSYGTIIVFLITAYVGVRSIIQFAYGA